jgi:argininosuccinate lyase
VEAGYDLEISDAPVLHRALTLADLAQVVELREAGVIPPGDAVPLVRALLEFLDAPPEEFPYDSRYGDAYNSRERDLDQRLGATSGWLHAGRTRREALRIAVRLVVRSLVLDLHEAACDLAQALADRGEEHATTLWADTTYLQPAQPSTFGHYLGAFAEETLRHLARLEQSHTWCDTSPAGVGGVAGPRLPLDRERLARRLGFGQVGLHTRDAMWSIDGLVDCVVAATQTSTTADRLAEDLEIFSSPAFGFVELDASVCRASVLMPQKRNPYALAVIRGGASVLVGRASGMLTLQRTPSARSDNWLYTCGEVTGALVMARRLVALAAEVVRTLRVDAARLESNAAQHFTGATDLADEILLRSGLDYRSAYRVVGHAVGRAIDEGRSTLTSRHVDEAATAVVGRRLGLDDETVRRALDPRQIVATRTCIGGAASRRVQEHCARVRSRTELALRWNADCRRNADGAIDGLVARARQVAALD